MKPPIVPIDFTGKLLVAAPSLSDPNFRHTVVLMLGSSTEGAVGLVLNRPSDRSIREMWEAVFKKNVETDNLLYIGGPVFGPLMLIHAQPDLADIEVFPGLYFSNRKDAIETIIENDVRPYKLFVGNASWGGSQLARELDESVWYLLPATRDMVFGEDVFSDETELWQNTLSLAGAFALQYVTGHPIWTHDPLLN